MLQRGGGDWCGVVWVESDGVLSISWRHARCSTMRGVSISISASRLPCASPVPDSQHEKRRSNPTANCDMRCLVSRSDPCIWFPTSCSRLAFLGSKVWLAAAKLPALWQRSPAGHWTVDTRQDDDHTRTSLTLSPRTLCVESTLEQYFQRRPHGYPSSQRSSSIWFLILDLGSPFICFLIPTCWNSVDWARDTKAVKKSHERSSRRLRQWRGWLLRHRVWHVWCLMAELVVLGTAQLEGLGLRVRGPSCVQKWLCLEKRFL